MNEMPKPVYYGVYVWNLIEGIVMFIAGVLCILNAGAVGLGHVAGGLLVVYAIADLYAVLGPSHKEIINAGVKAQVLNTKIGENEEEESK